jgi:hypothetical protein
MESLEQLAYKIVLLDETELALAGIGSYVFGFAVGFFKNRHLDKAISRSPFFLISGFVYFAASCVSLLWLFSEPASEIGVLWIVVLSVFLSLAVIGYFSSIACIYRSRDAFNNSNFAWLGIIPLLNLVLLFSSSIRQPENRLQFTPSATGGAGVFFGLLFFVLSAVPTAYVETAVEEYEAGMGSAQFMTDWANEVKLDSNLPQHSDNGLSWTDCYHYSPAKALVYKYVGMPDADRIKAYADDLWTNTDGSMIKSVGFNDILFLFYRDYSGGNLGVYSSKHGRWFVDLDGYMQSVY